MQRKSINELRVRKQKRSIYLDESGERGNEFNVAYHYDKGGNGFNMYNSGSDIVVERINNGIRDSYIDSMVMEFD